MRPYRKFSWCPYCTWNNLEFSLEGLKDISSCFHIINTQPTHPEIAQANHNVQLKLTPFYVNSEQQQKHNGYLPVFSSSGGLMLQSILVKITGKSCSCSRHRIAVFGFFPFNIRAIWSRVEVLLMKAARSQVVATPSEKQERMKLISARMVVYLFANTFTAHFVAER